jgi:DNA-binding CsgD family transcriptional regulator
MPPPQHFDRLTPAERSVLAELCAGRTLREVAENLTLSYETVRTHVKHLHSKTQTHSLVALVASVWEHQGCCLSAD